MQQQVVFSHNALLCGALEMIGATSGVCSQTPSGGGLCPPLESEITVVVCPPPPVDHARSTSSHLTPTGGVTPAAPSCRFLGGDSDQASGHFPEHLAVAAAGWVCSQGRESNNVVLGCGALPFLLTPVVTEATGGTHSQAPIVAGHTSLWPPRQLPQYIPASCSPLKAPHCT